MDEDKQSQNTKRVIWDWAPGPVAGLMPLLVFAFVSVYAQVDGLPDGHIDVHHIGWTAHWLVLAIVTSAVSTFSAYPRLFSERSRDFPIGRGSLGLMMINTLILVFAVSIYTLHEQYRPNTDLLCLSAAVAILSLGISLWLEFAIANLGLQHEEGDQPQNDGNTPEIMQ